MRKKIFKKNSNTDLCLYTISIFVLSIFLYWGQASVTSAQEELPLEDKTESAIVDPFSIKTQVPELFDLFMKMINDARLAQEAKLKEEAARNAPPRVVVEEVKLPPPVKVKVVLPEMQVTGIFYDGDQPMVLINGQVLQTGDVVAGAKIVKIVKGSIQFLFKEENFTIHFNNE